MATYVFTTAHKVVRPGSWRVVKLRSPASSHESSDVRLSLRTLDPTKKVSVSVSHLVIDSGALNNSSDCDLPSLSHLSRTLDRIVVGHQHAYVMKVVKGNWVFSHLSAY